MSFQGITLQWAPFGARDDKATVTVEVNGDQVAEQIFNPNDAAACEQFARLVCGERPGIDPVLVKKELAKVALEMKRIPSFKSSPTAVLPSVVASFICAAALALACDESYIALPLLVALASAVGNSRRIKIKGTWCEPAIVWAVIVADSGTVKSPAHELAMKPINRLQDVALRDYREAMKEFPAAQAIFEADMSEWKRTGRKKCDPPPEKPVEPVAVRYLVSDTTVEQLAVLLEQQPRGLLLSRDELSGWICSFDAYKSAKGSDVTNWLSMHRGGVLAVDRKGGKRLIHVPRASICIAGTVQPNALAAALGGARRQHFDNGLAARLLFASPPKRQKTWTDAEIDCCLETAIGTLVAKLMSLDMPLDNNGIPQPIDIPMSPAGKAAWIDFYNAHNAEQVELSSDLAAAWSKLEGYTARFALLIHLIRAASADDTLRDPSAVDEQSITAGVALSQWFGDEAARVYAMIGGDSEKPENRDRRELLRIIRNQGGCITVRELMQRSRDYRGSTVAAEKALCELVTDKIAEAQTNDHGGGRGRPVTVYKLIPGGNGNRNGEIVDESAFQLPLPPGEDEKQLPKAMDGEVMQWTA